MSHPRALQIGTGLPSHVPGPTPRELGNYATRAEALGFDSVWLPEHLLRPNRYHAHSFLDPVVALSFIAGSTERVLLGTAALVLPLRNPAILAKQAATLHHLSNGRFILGVVPGWSAAEFDAVGVDRRQRGALTDTYLEQLRRLTGGDPAYSIEPRHDTPLQIWIGGGSQATHTAAEVGPVIASPVARRIALGDGWLVRASSSLHQMVDELAQISTIRTAEGIRSSLAVTFKAYVHVVDDESRSRVREEQLAAFGRFTGHDPDTIRSLYLLGTIDEISSSLRDRIDAGVNHLIVAPIEAHATQLELIADALLPTLRREHTSIANDI